MIHESPGVRRRIVNIIRQKHEEAKKELLLATTNAAAVQAAHNVWEEQNPDDAHSFGVNPYKFDQANDRRRRAERVERELGQALRFAIDTFLQDVDDTNAEGRD